ncbi:hypothetical protein BGZ54_006195 [Gamsiella multidivaricata]|nr:hypothetical protein BGZ54_006195 [Gamsiella multidivaricata]
MALFPPQSDFDHLIVLLDRNGRGEIWNWKTVALVAILTEKSESGQDLERKRHEYRKDLYYWGVQINWSVEEPVISSRDSVSAFGTGAAHRKQGDFSVVALADGEGKEWETCWWNVSDKMLRMSKEAMPPQPTEIGWSSRYFQELTLGRTSPPSASQETRRHADKPLSFIAYLTWNHYRITLTSQHGLCIFDMDREVQDETMSGGSEISDTGTTMELEERQQKQIPQWVTMIDDAEDDPLVDIATMGDCLMLTRKYSHMIFPFRSSHARQP